MPLNVLFATRWYPSHDNPGRGIFVADQAAALRAAGVEVVVAAWEHALRDASVGPPGTPRMGAWTDAIAARSSLARPRSWGAPGVPVVRLPASLPARKGPARHPVELAESQAETLLAFGIDLARRWRIDLIHAHTGLPDGFAAARLADRLGLPLVVTEHESLLATRLETSRARAAYRQLLGPRRRLVAVSAFLRRQMAELLAVPEASIEVIPEAVDVAAFRPAGPAARDPNELLWVGSRQASKGTDELLRALAHLRAARPGLRLRLIGRAPGDAEEARLWALARELAVEEAVSFEPAAGRAEVAAAMGRAGVFVHPSPRETFGVVAVEALASGLPVAAAPSGGVGETLGTTGAFGEIAESAAVPALAAAIARTLDRRMEFDPYRLSARAAEFGAPAVAARVLESYRSVLPAATAGPPAPPPPSPPLGALPLIVGMRRRSALTRLASLSPELAASLQVMTTAGDDVPVGTAAWIDVDADREFREEQRRLGGPRAPLSLPRRVARAVRHPIQTIRLRRLAGRRSAMALAPQRRAFREQLAAMARSGSPTEVLILDADDLPVVEPSLDAHTRLYPTTLRGLADHWDGAGRPVPGSVDGAAAAASKGGEDSRAPREGGGRE